MVHTMCFESLPLSVLSNVLVWLPADERPCAALVCRRFRDALQDDHAVWASVDFSQSKALRLNDRLLQRVASKAGAHLTRLNLGEWVTTRQLNGQAVFSPAMVLGVVRSAPALRCLAVHFSVGGEFTTAFVSQLVAAAPQLAALETDAYAPTAEEACALLRNDAPFAAVRLRRLRVLIYHPDVQLTDDGLLAVTAQLASRHHVSLRELAVESRRLSVPSAFNALVDALVPRRMAALSFNGCLPYIPYYYSGGAIRALLRLLHGGFLSHLVILGGWMSDVPLLTDASALSLAAALRACVTLTRLTLNRVGLWSRPSRGHAVVAALVGHPSLRVLDLGGNDVAMKYHTVVGKPLARLVAANTPALEALLLAGCNLGNGVLLELFRALRGNTFLRELDCSYDYGAMPSSIARFLLGAVQDNSTLMALRLRNSSNKEPYPAYLTAAEAVVAARAAAQ